MDLSIQQFGQLLFHLNVIQEAPVRIGFEFNQKIYIAFRPKIIPQNGSEKRQLSNLPSLTKHKNSIFNRVQNDILHEQSSPLVSRAPL